MTAAAARISSRESSHLKDKMKNLGIRRDSADTGQGSETSSSIEGTLILVCN